MSQRYEKLKKLLMELFQLDKPDLDFGFYRVMHAKSAEVSQFLDEDLLPQVKDAFAEYRPADKAELEKELGDLRAGIKKAGMDPADSPKVAELERRLVEDAVELDALEAQVYDHLYRFFRRYYSDGDFLSKRVYKPGVYAIPYEGEEIKLHWANADQYYVKTSEYLKDYAFRLRPDEEAGPMRVHFRLLDAAEGEHGNLKEISGKERRFALATEAPASVEAGELIVRFTYEPNAAKQNALNVAAEESILGLGGEEFAPWVQALRANHVRSEGTESNNTRLRVHLDLYTARNTFDYFIHKNLGEFLRRELDFYIKNEVMHLDDIESETSPRLEQYLSKIKVIRRVAGKIITFLAQLEDFQKKLWLKKKFVVETSWCVRLACIPDTFLEEIAANEAQVREWIDLCAIEEIGGDLTIEGYCDPLTQDFLRGHSTLMVDTTHFDAAFSARLLDAIGDLDELTDGLLIHSENFQALRMLRNRYDGNVDCVYIDPPYNTGDSEILYKNTYLRASWLTLMSDRLLAMESLLKPAHVLFIAIDDFEMVNISKLIDTQHPQLRREMIVVNHHPQGGKAKTLSHTHEYMLACMPWSSARTLVGRATSDGVEQRPFKRSGTAHSNFRYGRPNSFYAILVDPESCEVVGIEPPPTAEGAYPTGPTEDGYVRVYPLGSHGTERVWRRAYESCPGLIEAGKLISTASHTIYHLIEAGERTPALFSNWIGPRYNAGTYGANLLRDIIGEQNPFSYPKSVHTVGDALFAADLDESPTILDFFAGSGTTGHAVLNLNREDGGQRRFVLVEMGDYFDSVLLPRLKKVTFSPEWKGGRPTRLATPEEAERSPRVLKIVRLESYEDTLNNLELHRTDQQQAVLALAEAKGADGLREDFLLEYTLDVETRGSPSLLNVADFVDPTAYRLNVKCPGSDESREVNVDLLDTFNWLVGLTVRHIAAPQTFEAGFERDDEGRLTMNDRLKPSDDGAWWFRTVSGTTPDGRNALVIWRKRPGGDSPEGVEQDNLVLDEWFTKQGYSSKDSEFDVIWVNGDNNLENLKAPDDTWKVRLIEEDFHRLMFDVDPV